MGTHVNDTNILTFPAHGLKKEPVKHNFKENGAPSMGGGYVLELGNWGGAPQEVNEGGAGDNLKAKHPRQWEQQMQKPWGRPQLATLMERAGGAGLGEPGKARGREGKQASMGAWVVSHVPCSGSGPGR